MERTEKEIVEDFINGGEESFNLIARIYQKKIYWHARRMLGNHDDADELTQEVLIVMYKKLNTFRFDSSLMTWVFQITSNRAKNFLKRRTVRQFLRIDKQEVEHLQHDSDIIKNVEDREKVDNINYILHKLPVKQREVFVLRNFDQLSYTEISQITGKTVGALKANYYHALQKVMELSNEFKK